MLCLFACTWKINDRSFYVLSLVGKLDGGNGMFPIFDYLHTGSSSFVDIFWGASSQTEDIYKLCSVCVNLISASLFSNVAEIVRYVKYSVLSAWKSRLRLQSLSWKKILQLFNMCTCTRFSFFFETAQTNIILSGTIGSFSIGHFSVCYRVATCACQF